MRALGAARARARVRCAGAASAGGGARAPAAAAPAAPAGVRAHALQLAPMMDVTDAHFRELCRLMSARAALYTEMVVGTTITRGAERVVERELWLPDAHVAERQTVLQLGGSDPATLAAAARRAAPYGYAELNLNVGCPSDKVAGAGAFGASLMLRPAAVGDCCAAMADASGLPVSVKCRLGVDDVETYAALADFVGVVAERGGVQRFIVHARRAILGGLTPEQNRSVPPLRHERVRALARDFPALAFSANGGVGGCHAAAAELARNAPAGGAGGATGGADQEEFEGVASPNHLTDLPPLEGVMVGRGPWKAPWEAIGDADRAVHGVPNRAASRRALLLDYAEYCATTQARFETKPDGHEVPSARVLLRPVLNIFKGEPGTAKWKRFMDDELRVAKARRGEGRRPPMPRARDVLLRALDAGLVPDDVLDAPPSACATARAAAGEAGAAARVSIDAAVWDAAEMPELPELTLSA